MATNPVDTAAAAPGTIKLGGNEFVFIATLAPQRDASGAIIELMPQEQYKKSDSVPLHKHGHGTFSRFKISVQKGLVGVYALLADGAVRYIGECKNLGKRINAGYGNISPKNCYKGGQSTNCKINRRVLDATRASGRVDLYCCPTPRRKPIERQLIEKYRPPWNG